MIAVADPHTAPRTPVQPAFDKEANRGLSHLANATRFSLRGLRFAVRNEAAFRQELALTVILVPAAFLVGDTPLEIALLLVSLLAVLVVELLNTALEAALDRIGTEHHPLTGTAKDLGSAAVFVALIATGLLWLAMLWQNHLSGSPF